MRSISLFFLMFWSFSCSNSDLRSKNSPIKTKNVTAECDTLKGLDNLQLFYGIEATKLTQYKIFVYFNGTCHTCISEMLKWNILLKTLGDNKNFDYIFITYTTEPEILSYYFNLDKIEYPVFLDADSTFIKLNNLRNKSHMAYIVDSTLKIIYQGNPIKDTTLMNEFLTKVEIINKSPLGKF